MEGCDDTASPNDESPSESRVSNFDPNYSLSDDSCCDSSDSNSSESNSSSLHEVSVCVLNGTQNLDLTIDKENRNQRALKE